MAVLSDVGKKVERVGVLFSCEYHDLPAQHPLCMDLFRRCNSLVLVSRLYF